MKKKGFEYFLVEGDCEARFIKDLKLVGQVRVFDLSKKTISQFHRLATTFQQDKKNIWINIVFDTDVLLKDPAVLQKFIQNLVALKKQKYKIRLLQQHRNFEEELCVSLKITQQKLFSLFNTNNAREFKSNFLSHQNSVDKILNLVGVMDFWRSQPITQLTLFSKDCYTYSDISP